MLSPRADLDRRTVVIRYTVEPAESCPSELRRVLAREAREAGQFTVLGPDPWQVLWNEARSGFVAFLEERHCLVTWRSPVAAPTDQADLLLALRSFAQHRTVFALGVNEATTHALAAHGFRTTWIGTECYLHLAGWSTAGGHRQKVRWARSHAARLGVTWREAFPTPGSGDESGLQRVEDRWKSERSERATNSFLRNDFRELREDRRYFVAERDGTILASLTCSPLSDTTWYLQDPVRDPSAPRGALEGAMAHALDTLRDDGATVASNGILPFWHVGDGTASPHQSGLFVRRVVALFDRLYRFRAINQFRSKFTPDAVSAVYVVRSRRFLTPLVVRSLVKLLT